MSKEIYDAARKKVKKQKEFYIHLFTFIPIMLLLAFISISITPEVWWWVLFPLFGWGIGLISHYLEVFDSSSLFLGKKWEEEQIEREIIRLKESENKEQYLKEELPKEIEEQKLKLKELEKRYLDDDLV